MSENITKDWAEIIALEKASFEQRLGQQLGATYSLDLTQNVYLEYTNNITLLVWSAWLERAKVEYRRNKQNTLEQTLEMLKHT